MSIDTRGTVVLLAIALSSACAQSIRDGEVTPRKDSSTITRAQLLEHHFSTAHDAVASLHANWLQTRGTDSFRTPSKVWVYFDSIKLGDVETLASISLMPVSYIQYFNGVDATTRWGIGHSAGVIHVSTHPVVAPDALH
jgi:hypothetical protein